MENRIEEIFAMVKKEQQKLVNDINKVGEKTTQHMTDFINNQQSKTHRQNTKPVEQEAFQAVRQAINEIQ